MRDWGRVKDRLARRDLASARLLLGLDFDGTLSEIVDSPDAASLSPRTRRLLSALTMRRDVRVAVLSGRTLADIRGRVGLKGVFYAGDHGLQIEGPGLAWIHPRAEGRAPDAFARLAARLRGVPGALLERKRLGLAVHYRRVPRARLPELRKAVEACLAELGGRYRVLHSKKTYDFRSTVAWNKGHALRTIRRSLAGAWRCVFVGDDRTDEEGFATLGGRALTIRVGRVKETAAQFVFERREQVDRLLSAVAARPAPPRRAR